MENRVLPSSESWHDDNNRNSGHEARQSSKWSSRWGPEDKEKESRPETKTDLKRQKHDDHSDNPSSVLINDKEKDAAKESQEPLFWSTKFRKINDCFMIDNQEKDAPKLSESPFFWSTKRHKIHSCFMIDNQEKDAAKLSRDPGFQTVPLYTAPEPLIGEGHLKTHVLFKIDDKPDGLNSKLAVKHSPSNQLISKVPTLIIGMDVSHDDSPQHPGGPAIATVVHSRAWPMISEYRAYVQTQVSRWPMIKFFYSSPSTEKLDVGMMREILQDFYTTSGEMMPQQIIVFRYSLGEPKYGQVLKNEISDLVEACKLFNEKWYPNFLVIKFCEPVGHLNATTYQFARAGYFESTMPLDYSVILDEVCDSPQDIRDLVNSFSYLYQMRTAAISELAPDVYGISPGGRLPQWQMSQKREIDPEKVCLRRECIDNGVELAEYALAFLNFERDVKHAFVRLIGWHSELDSGQVKQGVGMEAREINGDDASIVTIRARLCYSGGEYVSIEHSITGPGNFLFRAKYVPISQSLLDRKRHHDREQGAEVDQSAIGPKPTLVYGRKRKKGKGGINGEVLCIC